MRLKRVRIFGFKTFAEKAEFDIDGGIVAVVGPNGCGKSNLVDAILWGLGEGSAKHLRAHSGQDVIFNGSSRRKPVGFAEVSLLFDNEDGSLPIGTPEVTVSRRLNRAGESAYSINRQACRQRDVFELLADSGLGRSGYAIVGQKEIDQALAASPEDRRAWVDEAAGVQRYRARKLDSQRRLAAAQQHLTRVADILRELESQREPLRQDAELAKRYRSVLESLRSIEVGLLVKELSQAVADVQESTAQIDKSQKLAEEESERAEKAELKARQIGNEAADLEGQIELLWSVQQRGLMAQERAEADLKLAQQRLANLTNQELALGEEESLIKQRIADALAEVGELEREVAHEQESLERLRRESGSAGDEAKQLQSEASELEKRLNAARDLRSRALRLDAEAAHRLERIRQAKRELEGIDRDLPELLRALEEAKEALDQRNAAAEVAQADLALCDESLLAMRAKEDEDAGGLRTLLAERAALEGRIRGIEATLDAHEGLAQGPRAVLAAVQKGELTGVYTPVGEAIQTKKAYAVAIETALGAAANDLIVSSDSHAKAAIDWLKRNSAGRATFQPVPLMRPVEPSPEMRRLLGRPDVLGRACELVECPPEYRPVIESLLGRVLVVNDIDSALGLAKTSGWSRIVTLEGEVVHSAGAVSGGKAAKAAYGLVQRKADLGELETQLAKCSRAISDMEKAAQRRLAETTAARERHGALRNAVQESLKAHSEAKSFWNQLRDEHESAQRGRGKLEQEVATLQAVASEAIEVPDIAALEQERDAVLTLLAGKSSDAQQAKDRIHEAENRLRQAQIRLDGGERRLAAAKDSDEHRVRRIASLGPERERLNEEIRALEQKRTKAHEDRAESERHLEKLKAKKHALMEEAHRLGEESRQSRANASAVTDTVHRSELARARAESKRANAAERLLEDYGISEEEALAAEPQEIPADAASLVGRMRRELKAMGPVNLGAIDAFDRLTERCDELYAQRQDIEAGIAQVREGILELDKLTREKFLNTFEEVQTAFRELFERLFAGGEGTLSLTDPASVLETGIDIDVTLPGKKKQRLELLSGGERALCACAFLFALLRVKPSPLVVLDEVDAPLDGRNVERFVNLLRDFSETTQFIVVTHNPTTIESAPVWLGVTMQEPGISTLIPTRVPVIAPPVKAVIQAPGLAPVTA